MKLSVIIVNYNVKYFLELAVASALRACKGIAAEIIVVDNNSVDGSVAFIRNKFPSICIIENKKNTGFAIANNQAIEKAQGEYILLLNPDTVVQEDTFSRCIRFMDEHPQAGALGVKMVDGKGNFLPESKRGFPSPQVAFFKAFGLSAIFPSSKLFGRYHLGYLSKDATHEVEVLAGAFMFMRKNVLDKTGLLDETFFMYGEDIDLSYRIVQAGYKNYYYADTSIIHYKGESTKKGSLNYVKMFYTAMKIFAKKHFTGTYAGLFILLLNLAIYVRAFFAIFSRAFKKLSTPLFDAALIFTGMLLIREYWEYYVRYIDGGSYPLEYLFINVPVYITIWLICIFFSGGYDRTTNTIKIVRGIFWGTLVISALYGFLPESLRFSRGMIIAGAAWTAFVLVGMRFILQFIRHRNFRFGEDDEKNIIILGNEEEALRVLGLLQKMHLSKLVNGVVTIQRTEGDIILGNINQLPGLVELYQCNEIIFCLKDMSVADVMQHMQILGNRLDYKIVVGGSDSIVGSNSKNTSGDLYSSEIEFSIAKASNRRSKRLFDVLFSLYLLVSLPVQIFLIRRPAGLLMNIFSVLSNRCTWVGYAGSPAAYAGLPHVKKCVITRLDKFDTANDKSIEQSAIAKLNLNYAVHYSVSNDFEVINSAYNSLGKR